MSVTRLLSLEDAPRLTELVDQNREFHAPWEPARSEEHFTLEGQLAGVRSGLCQHEQGSAVPLVVLCNGLVVGRVNLTQIVHGPFQSANLGYWLDEAHTGRGLATAAVRDAVRIAFGELGLHRIQAGTLRHNTASQRVLERTGFVRFGLAPRYLRIAGRWQDHVLFQLLNEEPPAT